MPDGVVAEVLSLKILKEYSDPTRAAIDYAVAANTGIADNLLATQLAGVHKQSRRFLKYGKEFYYRGVPTAEMGTQELQDGRVVEEFPIASPIQDLDFYPSIPLRTDGVFLNEDEESIQYLDNRKMMKRINLKYNDLIDGLIGPEEEPNPDIDQLDDAYFIFGSDIYSPLEETAEMLYNLFEWLAQYSVIGKDEFQPIPPDPEDPFVYTNYFKVTQGQFNVKIGYNYIEIFTESGALDDKLVFKKSLDVIDSLPPTDPENDPIEQSAITIRKQISPGVINVVRIHGITHYTTIYAFGTYKWISRIIDPEFIDLDPESEDPVEANKAGTGAFYIPMSQTITDIAISKHRQMALYDGMTLALYAADRQKLAWYQSSIFRFILTIIGIVFTIFTAPAGATMNQIIAKIISQLVIQLVLTALIREFKGKLGILAQIAVTIVSIRMAGNISISGMPFATQLLYATRIVTSTMKAVQKLQYEGLQDEMDEFNDQLKDREKENNKLLAELGAESGLSALLLVTATSGNASNETPEDFYTRVLETNPGVLSLDSIEQYSNNLLTLPEFNVEGTVPAYLEPRATLTGTTTA